MTLEAKLKKMRATPFTKEQQKLLKTKDVFNSLPHDELMRRAEKVSKHIIHKNRKAYEALAYR